MDQMLERCAYGAWHYGDKICEVCRKEQKEQPVRFPAQVLLAAALAVGLLLASPAVAEAPHLNQAQLIKKLPPKSYALMKVKSQWLNPHQEYACLHSLWQKESNWRSTALNKSSGAFGIAQFLPSTWGNYKYPYKPKDPQVQIDAGLRYIYKRYETPCNAWAFWKKKAGKDMIGGWY